MGSRLVWLFSEHRDLFEENQRLLRIIADLERQLMTVPDASANQLVRQYQEEVLQDIPYPEGKIPENAWLTPGDARDQ